MADWTVILTALVSGGVTGALGFYTAKSSSKTALRQIKGENERLRAQHREDHLRNRQGTYHLLLNADRRYTNAILQRQDPRPAQQAFHDAAMGVVLFGSTDARDAMNAVLAADGELWDEASRRGGSADVVSANDLRVVWDERSKETNALKEKLLEAMRDDVKPRE